MKFVFRLQSVLQIRQHERDVQQQALVIARRYYDDQVAERSSLTEERNSLMDELRSMNDSENSFSAERVIENQRYADQLSQSLAKVDASIEEAGRKIDSCLKGLLQVDQAVRALERLSDRQRVEFEVLQHARDALDLDDAIRFAR